MDRYTTFNSGQHIHKDNRNIMIISIYIIAVKIMYIQVTYKRCWLTKQSSLTITVVSRVQDKQPRCPPTVDTRSGSAKGYLLRSSVKDVSDCFPLYV